MIIGPTIDEVSEWHDKGIFVGIYTAPSAVLYNFDNLKYGYLGNPFVKYVIKIKNSEDYECWVTNWPCILKNAFNIEFGHFPPMDFDTYVKKKLQLNIPINAYQKIKYMMDFYNHLT